MQIRILNLDGSLLPQQELRARHEPRIVPLADWGPDIRMACSWSRFHRFEQALSSMLAAKEDADPAMTFCGSGDFHHVSLALVRRLVRPVNLLVIDNHPDWMRGVPFLHCGTWLYHAARLGHIARIFHVGGEVDFDNYYGPLTPWSLLCSGRITVFPAIRRFRRGRWSDISNEPIKLNRDSPVSSQRMEMLLIRWKTELAARPLYISLDKDVIREDESVVNWDSGHLTVDEVSGVLGVFIRAAGGNLAGMDIVGDWSRVVVHGWLRHFMHFTEHPGLKIDPAEAGERNQQTNLSLLQTIGSGVRSAAWHDEKISKLKGFLGAPRTR